MSLYVNGTNITSRQLYSGTTVPSSVPTEAALLVDDCTTNSGTGLYGGSCANTSNIYGNTYVGTPTQGFLQNGAMVFSGFGFPANAGPGSQVQIRLTNIRVNASLLTSGTFIYGTVLGTFPIQNQSGLVLGVPQTSLNVSVGNTATVTQCQGATNTTLTNLTISELFLNAFKSPASSTQNSTPAGWYQNNINTESQTVLPATPLGWTNSLASAGVQPGKADAATRIRVNFSNIPSGVTISVPVTIGNTSSELVATSGGDLGAFKLQSGTSISLTTSGSVTYEVRAQQPSAIDSFTIPMTVSTSGSVTAGSVLVSATYAATTAESSTAIPLFIDTSSYSGYAGIPFTVQSCSPPTISCSPSTGPTVYDSYYYSYCYASGGNPPYAFSVANLLSGLSYDYGDGEAEIYGYPTATGNYSYSVTVTDSTNRTGTETFTGTIGIPTFTSISPTYAAVGSSSFTLTINGTYLDSNLYAYLNGYYLTPISETSTKATFSVPAYALTYSTDTTVYVYDDTSSAYFPFTVGANLQASPAGTISFAYQQLGAAPSAKTVAITSDDGIAIPSYTVTTPATTPWLSATPSTGSTPGSISISVNPSGMNPGTYSSAVTLASSSAANSPFPIPVALTVSIPATLQVAPTQLSFTAQQNAAAPASQTLSVTGGTSSVSYSVTTSTTNNGTWLSATPASGSTAGTVTVSVNPAGLTPGNYAGEVLLTSSAVTNSPVIIPVGFTITAQPSIVPTPASLSFAYTLTGTAPSAQSLAITSSGNQFSYTVAASTTNGGNWLTANSTSGTSPGGATISVNPTGLSAGTYNGTINITAPGAVNSPLSIPVTFTVSSQPTLLTTPSQVTVNYTTGTSNPAPVGLAVLASNSSAMSYTAAASSASWFSITGTSGTTPGNIIITVNPSGLPTGSYAGSITLTSAAAANSPLTVPITLNVNPPAPPGPPLQLSQTQLSFTASPGSQPSPQTISVTTSTPVTGLTLATGGGSWLSATLSSTGTPSVVSVSVSASGLPNGTYTGVVVVSAPGTSAAVTVPVTMTVTSTPALQVSPATLQFVSFLNTPAPLPQVLSISSASSTTVLSYNITTTSAAWLTVLPAAGSTPSSVLVSVDPTGLAAGSYSATISISSNGSGVASTIPVTLTVKPASSLFTSPSQLTFNAVPGVSPPAAQSVSVFSSTAGDKFSASLALDNGGDWAVAAGASSTPGNIVVSVSAAGLAPGTYTGELNIASANNIAEGINVPLTLNVAAASSSNLRTSSQSAQFSYTQGSAASQHPLYVFNDAGASLSYTAQATTQSCGNWLNVANTAGTATSAAPGVVILQVNPASLTPQTCYGQLTISGGSPSQTIPVSLTISAESQSIALSQTALNFVSGSSASPASQTFSVLNPGTSAMNWSVVTETLTGANWLTATPSSGTAPTPVSVSVNPQGLAPGTYYGAVRVLAPGAGNGPKSVAVILTVSADGQIPVTVSPAGVIFSGTNSQTVTLTNGSGVSMSFMSTSFTDDGEPWLTANPASGTVPAGGTLNITLQASSQGLGAGLRHGVIRFGFADGSSQTVDAALASGGAAASPNLRRPALVIPGCGSSDLALVFQSPARDFTVAAQAPVPIQVLAQDCTGAPITFNAAVSALVDGTEIPLQSVGNGIWTGTWTPSSAEPLTQLQARATLFGSSKFASGSMTINGAVLTAGPSGAAAVTGVVNGASFQNPWLVAPGSWTSIFGVGLAGAASTDIRINGQSLHLDYVSDSQINALVPSTLTPNERDQLVVYRNGTISQGVDIIVSDAAPGIFAALAGDTVQIYCTGLGAVTNAPPDGTPAAANPLSATMLTPQVTIGGVNAQVTFSGLAPGQVGVYQINAQLPSTVTSGDAVPLTVKMGNAISNTATIGIH
jgi:uncharacterized protein (TIGR03437 family)